MGFTKFSVGEEVPGPHHHPKCRHCGFKNVGLESPKSWKLTIFGINFPQRGTPA